LKYRCLKGKYNKKTEFLPFKGDKIPINNPFKRIIADKSFIGNLKKEPIF
jgi:hypothetical protein